MTFLENNPIVFIKQRKKNQSLYKKALDNGLSELLANIVANRLPDYHGELSKITHPHLRNVAKPSELKDIEKATKRIVDAITKKQTIGILTDYDADGVTSHCVISKAFTEKFQVDTDNIRHYIGHRLKDGYGVSDALTQRILNDHPLPNIIITADCGSADEARIKLLKQADIDVIITDHHTIPDSGIPASAFATINPGRKDCDYPDKTIAGCMVAWLLMANVRTEMLKQKLLPEHCEKLAYLLPFVALGTIADCVSMSYSPTNRAIVNIGLMLINQMTSPCWQAMQTLIGNRRPFNVMTLAFQVAPRINARSRLADPFAALHFLLAEDLDNANKYLNMLDEDNQTRKKIEREMTQKALPIAAKQTHQAALCVYLDDGHPGVQGIVASRLVQKYGKPAMVLTNAKQPTLITGSVRSIPGVNIYTTLRQCAASKAHLFTKFGGHKGAAGLTLEKANLADIERLFPMKTALQLTTIPKGPTIWSDGQLTAAQINRDTLEALDCLQPYGRDFESPIFDGYFTVNTMRRVGNPKCHLSMTLKMESDHFNAIWFNAIPNEQVNNPFNLQDKIHCAYSLNVNEFRQCIQLQLIIEWAYCI